MKTKLKKRAVLRSLKVTVPDPVTALTVVPALKAHVIVPMKVEKFMILMNIVKLMIMATSHGWCEGDSNDYDDDDCN
ncbi:hypothetical protein J6590_045342 [Homalodisca vitripennis]|nr:hypothetical protein J6590_045342 [Homalodisca vitripennis]